MARSHASKSVGRDNRPQFSELAPVFIGDALNLRFERACQVDKQDRSTRLRHGLPDMVSKIGCDRSFRLEREDQGPVLGACRLEDIHPELLAQSPEGKAAKREDGCHTVHDKMVMEQRRPGQRCQFAAGSEFSGCGRSIEEDEMHDDGMVRSKG